MERTNEMVKAVIGVIAGPGAVALSFEERLSLILRLTGLVLGCGVSAAMFWSIVANRIEKSRVAQATLQREQAELRVQEVQYQRELGKLCHWCQQGQPPPQCPLPAEQCPSKKKLRVES
ncbi:MAG TPA: hypothetical protein VMU04_24645 [Candidatus Acidoferrum sp.]|nr:hypothetical protein [Candidatus Acidoferrum sp.]